MLKVDSLELFLYVIPILEIILIHLYFKSYLQYKSYIKFSVTDVIIPILLVGIHILSVRLLSYSLLPHYLFVLFLVGLVIVLYYDFRKKKKSSGKIFSLFRKIAFLGGFIFYYTVVFLRLWQVYKR